MLPIVIGVLTGLATLAGGALALRFRASMNMLLGLGGGALLGMALCDMLPEALELARGARGVLGVSILAAIGFAAYFALDRGGARKHRLGPASLVLHSLIDGLGVGLAFQASPAMGLIAAAAVLTHDLVDGVNSVALSLSGGMSLPGARRWLTANALAPLAGVGLSRLISVPPSVLSLLLALFAGFFLYVGAGLLMRPRTAGASALATLSTAALGVALIYSMVRIAGVIAPA